MIEINELLDLSKTIAAGLFEGKTYPWEVLDDIKALADNFVQDYHKSPVKTIAKRVPIAVDMIDTLIGNEEIVNLLLDLLKDVKIGDETIGDYEDLIRRVIANFTQTIGPALTDTLNEDTIALYEKDKLAGIA